MKIFVNNQEKEGDMPVVLGTSLGLLAYGATEGLRVVSNGTRANVFALEQHLDRLERSAAGLRFALPRSRQQIRQQVLDTIRANHLAETELAYVRLYALAGNEGGSGEPASEGQIITMPGPSFLYHETKYRSGLRVTISSYRRVPPESLAPSIKSIQYGTNLAAHHEAQARGFDDALMLGMAGDIQEGPFANILFVENEHVIVSPPERGILPGITRATLLDICKKRERSIEVRIQEIFPDDLHKFQEAFFCGTQADVIPVINIDDQMIGDGKPGKITDALSAEYRARLRE